MTKRGRPFSIKDPVVFNVRIDRELNDWLSDYADRLSTRMGVLISKNEALRWILREEQARESEAIEKKEREEKCGRRSKSSQ